MFRVIPRLDIKAELEALDQEGSLPKAAQPKAMEAPVAEEPARA